MKTIQELSNILSDIPDAKLGYIDTKQKPSAIVNDVYQYVYDLFDFLIDTRIDLARKKKSGSSVLTNSTFTTLGQEFVFNAPSLKNLKAGLSAHIIIGGGCLSEQFIDGYSAPLKDIDVFIGPELYSLLTLSQPITNSDSSSFDFRDVFLNELNIFTKSKPNVEEKPFLFKDDQFNSNYGESRDVVSAYNFEFQKHSVDLIFMSSLQLDFDFSFRQFFYNGGNILATENALQDIENKTITVSSLSTPVSSYVRLMEFASRYPLSVDEFSRELLEKNILYKIQTDKDLDLKESFANLKKYNSANVFEIFQKRTEKITLTPFQTTFFKDNVTCSDKISLFRNRLKFLFDLDEQGENIPLSFELDLSKVSPLESNFDSADSDRTEFEKFIYTTLREHQFKKLFVSDANTDSMNLYRDVHAFFNGSDSNSFSKYDLPHQHIFDVHRYIYKNLKETVPNFTPSDFYDASLLDSLEEATLLYHLLENENAVAKISIHAYLYPSFSNGIDIMLKDTRLFKMGFRNSFETDEDSTPSNYLKEVTEPKFTDKLTFFPSVTQHPLFNYSEIYELVGQLILQKWNRFVYPVGGEPVFLSRNLNRTLDADHQASFCEALDATVKKLVEYKRQVARDLENTPTPVTSDVSDIFDSEQPF